MVKTLLLLSLKLRISKFVSFFLDNITYWMRRAQVLSFICIFCVHMIATQMEWFTLG